MSLLSIVSPTIADVIQEADSVPTWLAVAAFVISSFLAVIKIIEATTWKSDIDFRITREVFFRLLPRGECLYANGVAVAHGTGALVEGVEATLEMQSESGGTKRSPLAVVSFGEKVIVGTGLSRFDFYTSSPLHFMPASVPQRITYLCAQEGYAETIRRAFDEFQGTLYALRAQYSSQLPTEEETGTSILREANACVEGTCSRMIEPLQVEPGRYRLTLTLVYRQKGKVIGVPRKKTKQSSLEFEVGEAVRDQLRGQLRLQLGTLATNILLDQEQSTAAPQYDPINIHELDE